MVHLAKRRFDIVNDQQVILLVIPPIFLVVATAVVIVRWRARQAKRINTLAEDLLCLCGLIMSLLVVIIIFVLVLVDGQGMSTVQVKEHFGEPLGYRFWIRVRVAFSTEDRSTNLAPRRNSPLTAAGQPRCTICAVLRMDCVFPFFADIHVDPIGAAWGRMLFSPLEIAVGIIACSIPTLTPFHNRWRSERRQLPKEGPLHGLRRLKFRSGSSGSSTSNLNPANWVGKNAGHNNAFVSLEDGGKSSERVKDLGGHDIKVTKEYNVVHRT
ncbi:hypothetical protein N0V90_007255 [Kalmusia sp. IMI 367209]|nr:hypothetical protein N0V90_007255 [Kalmusia sp. IMI 367209]